MNTLYSEPSSHPMSQFVIFFPFSDMYIIGLHKKNKKNALNSNVCFSSEPFLKCSVIIWTSVQPFWKGFYFGFFIMFLGQSTHLSRLWLCSMQEQKSFAASSHDILTTIEKVDLLFLCGWLTISAESTVSRVYRSPNVSKFFSNKKHEEETWLYFVCVRNALYQVQ